MASMRAIQLTTGPELDFLQLRYCADAHVLAARWQRPVTPAELRHGYTATLEAAESVSCPYWLVDLRGRTAPDVHGAHWLSAEFLPRVPRHLGGAVYVGLLLPPHYDYPFNLPDGNLAPAQAAGQLTVHQFDEEGALTQWLAQCQGR